MTQGTFFDDDDPSFQRPEARWDDPTTSHDAARDAAFHASLGRVLALKCLLEHGPCTDYELEAHTGWQKNSIGKRRLECQRSGLVELWIIDGVKQRRPAPSGSDCYVWKLTEKGRLYITPKND